MEEDGENPAGRLVEESGEVWYRMDGVERMPPFLLSVVSDTDLWMFASSTGALTAGRRDADHAFLPYETDDRLHRNAGTTGPVTVVVREEADGRGVWRPFDREVTAGCRRAVAKHVLGCAVAFEEVNDAWGLTFRATWQPSPTHGWVRTVEVVDHAGTGATVEVLDGIVDVMPTGVPAETEQRLSNLVDAYKRSEVGPWGSLAVYSLESLITDRAEPAEALAATIVWSTGPAGAKVHLDEGVVAAVVAGREFVAPELVTGRRGSYLVHTDVQVPPAGTVAWDLVVDVGLGHAQAWDRIPVAADPSAPDLLAADAAAGRERLRGLLADADGLQVTADPIADAHHLSNVLFNCLRGGLFPYGHRVPVEDLVGFLADRNGEVHARHAEPLRALGHDVALDEVRALADASDDPALVRLVLEYLPLTFSRRHGDPSRPWNRFTIRTHTADGHELLAYEGNWRDIFQNWEALLRSYPAWCPNVVAKFVNASTLDGHNPYRLTRDGIDWEVPDPDDPWSNIGYWGDHQVVYLLRLLKVWSSVDPDGLSEWLTRPVFAYADVPYRLADHEAMLADPRDTITYDEAAAEATAQRVEMLGADGLLVSDGSAPVHVSLAEKLLVAGLAKLSAYVPGGGIWMNTQRPEWNDANNALAGYGLSMVTLHQLEAYLDEVRRLLAGAGVAGFQLTAPVADWLAEVAAALADEPPSVAGDDHGRRRLLDRVSRAGAAYRHTVRDRQGEGRTTVALDAVDAFLASALAHVRHSAHAAKRPDGLVHSYNLVRFPDDVTAAVAHLPLMLEGQVAALGATVVDGRRAVEIVSTLFASDLFREDQQSFLLYPAHIGPAFLDRNTIADEVVQRHPVLRTLAAGRPSSILHQDAEGRLHFRPGLSNAEVLEEALATTDLSAEDQTVVLEVYEDLFDHHAFTGRSGGMFGYEGIGSIYWHMVSKLLLAVQMQYRRAVTDGAPATVVDGLALAYRRVRDGLGYRKDAATFGAIPTDAYSHTPAHAGAQQPGMTGQVKEEVLARLGELGLWIEDGRLLLGPSPLPGDEVLAPAADGRALHCTVAATPVEVRFGQQDAVTVHLDDGTTTQRPGLALTRDEAADVFGRTGRVARVVFTTRQWPTSER